jgi:oligosaccharide repeat unit polymerase
LPSKYDVYYIITVSFCWFFLYLGVLWYKIYFKKKKRFIEFNTHNFNSITAFLVLSSIALYQFYNIIKYTGFDLMSLLKPYGFESSLSGNYDKSIFDSFSELILISTSNLVFSYSYYNNKKFLKYFSSTIILFFALILVIRGSRNIASMMLFPFIFTIMRHKSFSIYRVITFAIIFYLLGYSVGVIRNAGFGEIANLNFQYSVFDPLAQEFGTNYSLFTKWIEFSSNQELDFGRTYFIDPLVNLIPYNMWPNRPQGPAIQFSMSYFGVSNVSDLKEGLGFSPIIEAFMNFSYFGLLPVFLIFPFVFCRYSYFLFTHKSHKNNVLSGFLILIVLNWFRIDFATCFKIFLIFFICTQFFSFVFFKKINFK